MFKLTKRQGFTLIELLVTIAIIALLAVLLLPAISRLKGRGTAVKFQSNLRTAATALLCYAADHDGTFPRFRTGINYHWLWAASDYLGEDFTSAKPDVIRKSVLHDPSDNTVSTAANNLPVRNVAINGAVYDITQGGVVSEQAAKPIGVTNRKLASIERPSQLMMLGGGPSAKYNSNHWGNTSIYASETIDWTQCQRYPEGLYFAFVDGHVELKTLDWVQYEYKYNGINNMYRSAFFDWNATNPVPLVHPSP